MSNDVRAELERAILARRRALEALFFGRRSPTGVPCLNREQAERAMQLQSEIDELTARGGRMRSEDAPKAGAGGPVMSHFKTMFAKTDNGQSYLLNVSIHGEVVCYRLDPEGRATDMACGKPEEAILKPLRAFDPMYDLVRIGQRSSGPQFDLPGPAGPFAPYEFGFRYRYDTWADLLAVLSGPARSARAEARGVIEGLCTVGLAHRLDAYLHGSRYVMQFVLGPSALAFDAAKREEP
jgi:hypothetical protein